MFRFGTPASGSSAQQASSSTSQPTSSFSFGTPTAPLLRPTPLPTISAPSTAFSSGFGAPSTSSTATVDPRLVAASTSGVKQNVYMGVPAGNPSPEKSFEETRVEDYIRAYQATRKAPQPQPVEPQSENARKALGFAPHFIPHVESASDEQENAQYTDGKTQQVFIPVPIEGSSSGAREVMQSLTAHPNYATHSFEELRVNAYAAGNKTATVPPAAPATATVAPFSITTVATTSNPQTAFTSSSSTAPLAPFTKTTHAYASEPGGEFQSISTSPAFLGHSFEELRIAYKLAGREVNSQEINQATGSGPLSLVR